MEKLGNIEYPIQGLVMIVRDDVKVIDFLADLKSRMIIETITEVQNAGVPQILLFYHKEKKIFTLIIFSPMVEMGNGDNRMILFAAMDITLIISYVTKWRLMEYRRNVKDAIMSIERFLHAHASMNQPQANYKQSP